jgi:hypothetical protein
MKLNTISKIIIERPIQTTIIAFAIGSLTTCTFIQFRHGSTPPSPVCYTVTDSLGDPSCHKYTYNPFSDTKISDEKCQLPDPQCP